MMFMGWLKNLPTEFQFALAIALLGVGCWIGSVGSATLALSIGNLLMFLGTIASLALGHGAVSRMNKPDGCKDLLGDGGK